MLMSIAPYGKIPLNQVHNKLFYLEFFRGKN